MSTELRQRKFKDRQQELVDDSKSQFDTNNNNMVPKALMNEDIEDSSDLLNFKFKSTVIDINDKKNQTVLSSNDRKGAYVKLKTTSDDEDEIIYEVEHNKENMKMTHYTGSDDIEDESSSTNNDETCFNHNINDDQSIDPLIVGGTKLDDSLTAERWYTIAFQVLIPYIIAGYGMVGAGIVLDIVQHWTLYKELKEIYVLVPALLGLKGNLEMTLASRFSTQV